VKRILVIGAGYVGLVTAACMAHVGHSVIGLDNDPEKINLLQEASIPIYEPDLREMVKEHLGGRLRFTISYEEAVPWAEIVIVAVGTPSDSVGNAELKYVWQVIGDLALHIQEPTVVAIKSTVPVGTCDEIDHYLDQKLRDRFGPLAPRVAVLANPEFLREGRAVADFMKADRVVIGGMDDGATLALKEVYEPLQVPIIVTDRRSAELIKYASNAFLATKISFINSIGHLCERLGADVVRVAEGMGYDHRIMHEHLRAGLGYGGSCFPKDTAALLNMARRVGYAFEILQAAVKVNDSQIAWVVSRLEEELVSLEKKIICVWGLAFKPLTNDVRESQALKLALRLAKKGAVVRGYDPAVHILPSSSSYPVSLLSDKYEAVRGAHALIVATEWPEFLAADFQTVHSLMELPICIDARNCLGGMGLPRLGFQYRPFGRPGLDTRARVFADYAD
jgi:UDPglucose 6-dehydrogenase